MFIDVSNLPYCGLITEHFQIVFSKILFIDPTKIIKDSCISVLELNPNYSE